MIGLDPELAAAEVLARAEVSAPPIDPVRVSHLWPGLRVTLTELDGAGYLFNLHGRIGEMLLRRLDPPERRRYTCAHELGHWLLATGSELASQRRPHASIERWCDRFAAALLMPAAWVVDELVQASLDIDAILGLPGRFGVSRHAALLRVNELAPLELGIVTLSSDSLTFAWTTARERAGRFDWIDAAWLAHELREDRRHVRLSTDGVKLQARRLTSSRWLVTLASSAALASWCDGSTPARRCQP
jgi:Zn-dependent peptidase ImmA (M78 family)